ncbi:MAG: (Fe-S)-binding protein, partial [Candidatus Helarchaeota archaeon]
MAKKRKIKYLKGKGITKLISVPDQQTLDRNQHLEYYENLVYQCGKCGTCRSAYQSGWDRICPSGEYGGFESYYLGGKNLLTWAITSGQLEWSENLARIFYHCTLCLACTQQCQIAEIHHYAGEWLMAMREEAVRRNLGPMAEHIRYTTHILNEHNPYMEPHADRLKWVPANIKQTPNAKIVYFVGCTSSYREQNVAVATAELLNKMGVPFQILKEESCCGSPIYMTGQAEKAKELAKQNVKIFKDTGIETIITSCAGCYRAWKEVYPEKFGLDHGIEVLHLPEFILNKLEQGELNFNKEVKLKITYHDPCHIGRHMGIYEPPRKVLTRIPGIELIEMPRNRHNAWCCGSGGGVRSAFQELSKFSAEERIEEAKNTHVEAIVSACPFCLNQFKTNLKNQDLKAFDLSELIRNAL